MLLPAAQRLGSKLSGVMINPYTHPAIISSNVVYPIRNTLAQLLVEKILTAHLDRWPMGMPFPPRILEIPDQFLLLRVNRYHRLPAFLKRPDLRVDMLELRITVGMRTAFLRFPIRLQAI